MKRLFALKNIFATALLLAVMATPRFAHAQFGFGIVYDPTNYANAVLRYTQLVQQLNQLRSTYAQILNQYNLAVQMSKSMPNMSSRYSATWSPWRYASSQDAYGNAGPWIDGVNSGSVPTVLSGYQRATSP